MTKSSVQVLMQGVKLEANVGVHPWEKHPERPTVLVIDLTLEFEHATYLALGHVDYDPLRNFIKELSNKPHIEWLETIADKILRAAFSMTRAERVTLQIVKPEIFNEVDAVGVRFDVLRQDFKS